MCINQEAVTKTGYPFGKVYVKYGAGKKSFGNRMTQTLEMNLLETRSVLEIKGHKKFNHPLYNDRLLYLVILAILKASLLSLRIFYTVLCYFKISISYDKFIFKTTFVFF